MSNHTKPVPEVRRLLAVCAHPYDATFALGGVIAAFADAGTAVHIVCLTHGRRTDAVPRRRLDRARDLGRASRHIGAEDVTLLDHAPGTLMTASIDELAAEILDAGRDADALLAIDATGPDAHPDHVRTMRATYRAATRLGSTLYAWTLRAPQPTRGQQVLVVDADRERQRAAIACHTGLPADDPLRSRWLNHQQREERLIVLRTERVLSPVATRADL
ncbi:PIG-L deacetylase family protein [Jiangella mangrovi]|uniref:LmbE family N-acetylglucosaminyl deacetylase n=1 Tax=Jiangella mangrovi TaxID=1524084 RepID=A0A7W9GRL3_9ACTN|nr:PIG-L family deacetylase [Jiangella mangrovi]MBB5788763.1 LmbE family N-acetylglucosaminyl deacetylase [Jiangella mangrovi]